MIAICKTVLRRLNENANISTWISLYNEEFFLHLSLIGNIYNIGNNVNPEGTSPTMMECAGKLITVVGMKMAEILAHFTLRNIITS